MSDKIQQLKNQIPAHLLSTKMAPSHPLASGLSPLDQWLQKGLAWGRISEWGMPPGQDARRIVLRFLNEQNKNFLWIHSNSREAIYPTAWASQISLAKAFFISSDNPVSELKACFLENVFPLIILDSPQKLSTGDLAFLSSQTRNFQQHLFLLRPFYLSSKKGNPYAHYRINVFRDYNEDYQLKKLRGPGSAQNLTLNKLEVAPYECASSFF